MLKSYAYFFTSSAIRCNENVDNTFVCQLGSFRVQRCIKCVETMYSDMDYSFPVLFKLAY